MPTQDIAQVERVWPPLARHVFVPHSEKDYQKLVALLDSLIDTIGEDESHELASLMELLGVLIEKYEDEHVPNIAIIGRSLDV
jgi:HTH-type transcriptional regulator/antitoxin HigA